ncbi:MAG: hypothetical protein IE923_10760 [Micrococcales bacterium]|uniref:hypothetical protein n=1 Tax=Cellulomonas sp. P4 TaxID=3142533 RepID=UPI0019B4915F|nr:hypothetical protein [Micrococcales bacterium]
MAPRLLSTQRAIALIERARELLGSESMSPYSGISEVVQEEVSTFARLGPDDSSVQRPVPADSQLFCGHDDSGFPMGELIFWVKDTGEVGEIELVWYSNDLPDEWPSAADLWVSAKRL